MQNNIYTDPLIITFDNCNGILLTIWNTKVDLPLEEYKDLVHSYIDSINYYKPLVILVDARNANFAIPVETQDWLNEITRPLYKRYGIEKMALIMSNDFIAQLSFEQTIQDLQINSIDIKYFESTNDANEWVYKNINKKQMA
ncbi:hypothetical protein [Chondrinema litorale]|uniref:hypothetical protein n=1 Tax=Chondrinema litorale TaxID=2994555 RepID=UPI00254280D3|nr:hypothetical protein [Chondrinema litorale]UZR95430.1 hypothetical protein OQ292_06335 [Chondrinema litorale]